MTRVLVAAVSAALLIGAVVSPANAGHGGGDFHGGAGVFHGGGGFHGGGSHGGEHFHEAFRGGGFHEGFHGERFRNHDRFHDHDHFRGPVIVGGLSLGLGLGAVGGALLPPSVYYGPPAA